jgi:hypothetical protein
MGDLLTTHNAANTRILRNIGNITHLLYNRLTHLGFGNLGKACKERPLSGRVLLFLQPIPLGLLVTSCCCRDYCALRFAARLKMETPGAVSHSEAKHNTAHYSLQINAPTNFGGSVSINISKSCYYGSLRKQTYSVYQVQTVTQSFLSPSSHTISINL